MVHGRFASDGGSGSLFRSIHDVSCGSLVVALDVVRLFSNDWAALLETKGRLQACSSHVPVCHVSVMSISVTACTQTSSSLKDSTWLSLIFLVSTAQSYLESSQNHRVLHSSV